MGLIDLKTNLKSLKYEQNSLGSGNGEPYIVTPLPDNANALQKLQIISTATSQDFPLRGGASSIIHSTLDLVRIGKFILSPPKGPIFIAKQIGLQLSNPKIETGKILGLENTRIYNAGLNTLAQIPVTAAGIHFDRPGLLPVMSEQNKYENIVKTKNFNTPENNRLVKLYENFILALDTDTFNPFNINGEVQSRIDKLQEKVNRIASGDSKFGSFVNKLTGGALVGGLNSAITKIKRATNPKYFEIDSYLGGPGSVYGIGRTTLNRYVFTDEPRTSNNPPQTELLYPSFLGASLKYVALTGKEINTGINEADPTQTPEYLAQTSNSAPNSLRIKDEIDKSVENFKANIILPNSHLNSIAYNYNMLQAQKIADSSENYTGFIGPDFRSVINQQLGGGEDSVLQGSNYKEFNMIKRVGIGDPGKPKDRRKVDIVDPASLDKINIIPLTTDAIDSEGRIGPYNTRDLIKFRFEAVNNDNPLAETTKIVFRAFITGFGDDYSANWHAFHYVGRGEEFYTYQGFKRSISFNLKIAAQSRAEMRPLYQKLNYLISNTMPDYNDNGFMRGSFLLLTIGSWLYRQPGILNNLKISINDDYPWEIAMNEPEGGEDTTMAELPQILDVNISFTPVHNFLPKKGARVPFIATGRGPENNWIGDVTGENPINDQTNRKYV